jgi:hypothetical protein
MPARLYRVIETLQRADEALRLEQLRDRPNRLQILRLKQLKLRAKKIIRRFALKPARG